MTPADLGIAAAIMDDTPTSPGSTTTISFTKEEVDDLIYAAREATIRFKRARTEFRKGNEEYAHWDEEVLREKIMHYANLEATLKAKYEAYYGEW